ncbi:MAG: hypothetical protein JSR99_14390 [Proteobacteria bacterium]|nr:hypothetical protein [Pseudomonadota bacterium]
MTNGRSAFFAAATSILMLSAPPTHADDLDPRVRDFQASQIDQIPRNDSNVTQIGSGNSSIVDQRALAQKAAADGLLGNWVNVYQNGYLNTSTIGQGGTGNDAQVRQQGNNNDAAISQKGTDLGASITQDGTGHEATIQQYGAGKEFDVQQSGAPKSIDIRQYGNGTGPPIAVRQY